MGKHVRPEIPAAPQGYDCWEDMETMNALKSKLGGPGPIRI